jgi:hypothetical protein
MEGTILTPGFPLSRESQIRKKAKGMFEYDKIFAKAK